MVIELFWSYPETCRGVRWKCAKTMRFCDASWNNCTVRSGSAEDQSQAGVIALQTPLPGKQAPKNGQVLVYYGAYQG